MNTFGMIAGMALLAAVLVGCEGVTTGTEVVRLPLQAAEDGPKGAYVPVKFNLGPEMNPVAVNFRADFSQSPSEFGQWNTYRVTLTQGGNVVATRNININHPQGNARGDAPPPTSAVHTLFITDISSSGEYVLTIDPLQPAAIVLSNAQVDVRRNVQRPPQ